MVSVVFGLDGAPMYYFLLFAMLENTHVRWTLAKPKIHKRKKKKRSEVAQVTNKFLFMKIFWKTWETNSVVYTKLIVHEK